MAATASRWNPDTRYVQSGGAGPGLVDGQFLNGQYMGLFAGPPRLASVGGAVAVGAGIAKPAALSQIVYPIGILQNFSWSSNKQVARIWELGSNRSYQIPGRTMGLLNLGRVMYHGPSLLRVLMAYYQDLVPATVVPAVFPNIGASAMPNPHDVIVPPGFENFYMNLASDLFDQPFGLLAILRDNNQDTYGATYFEACMVPSHSMGTDAQGLIFQEQVGIQYELCVPIATRMLSLIR